MRLAAVLVTAILTAAPAMAQGPPDTLPVSLDKIRAALAQPVKPALKLDERPMFRVEIVERQKIEELMKVLDFNSGPAIPGGLYGYDQQQRLFPPVNYPQMQPFAAFTPGEMIQVSATTLLQNYHMGKIMHGISSARSAKAQRSASDEVRRAIAEYCAAQPDAGAGILICTDPTTIR